MATATACLAHGAEGEEEYTYRSSIPAQPIPAGVTLPEYLLLNVIQADESSPSSLALALSNRVAMVDASDDRRYTYGQARKLVNNIAAGLHQLLGVRKGDVVFVLLPNMAEYFIIVLGIMWAGAIFSGGNPFSSPAEIEKQIENSEATVLVTDRAGLDKLKHLPHRLPILLVTFNDSNDDTSNAQLPPGVTVMSMHRLFQYDGSHYLPAVPLSQDDVCALPYSSGTTGLSKGVKLTHRNILANITRTCFDPPTSYHAPPPQDKASVVLGLMPFFHIYGTTGICCCTMKFLGTVVVMPRFDLRLMLEASIKYQVNFIPLVPPIILQMVKSPIVDEFDLSKLRLEAIMTAAAPLGSDLQTAFQTRFPGVEIRQAYGLTEYSCITLSHVPPGYPRGNAKHGSVGFLIPGTELKVIDPETGMSLPAHRPGEICVRGESTMQGYFKNAEATAATIDAHGWLHTGDIGYIDCDGDLFMVERAKELIKYKGFQVPPAELEAILLSHPHITDAAVIPLPDEEAGEVPAACVVRALNASLTEDDVKLYVQSQVAGYKKVRHVEFVTSIPKSSSGKILRRLLKEEIVKKIKANAANTVITT